MGSLPAGPRPGPATGRWRSASGRAPAGCLPVPTQQIRPGSATALGPSLLHPPAIAAGGGPLREEGADPVPVVAGDGYLPLFMAPSSQRSEPPGNPGRFRSESGFQVGGDCPPALGETRWSVTDRDKRTLKVRCGPAPLTKYSCALLPLAVASGRDLSHRGLDAGVGGEDPRRLDRSPGSWHQ